ncbi:MAG: hypothetical protein IKN87_00595 [Bacilli bacterium]|nr:hypothetical protein [Bacilli bacterium]
MEFREYTNPEQNNYDITSGLNSYNYNENVYSEQLMDLIGILEDISDEELYEQYGITEEEYLNPTAETIEKVLEKVNGRHR